MSKELKSSANTGAKEKGIEERTYDLRSKFSDDEYGFLLSRVFDKFEDLDNELYLKVISNRRILSDDIEQLQSIIRDYLKVTSINDRYLMGTAILQKLFDLLRSEPSKVTEAEPQEQSDVTDTEPQEQEREVKKTSANTGAKEKGIYDLQSRARYDIIEVHSVEIDNFKFDNRDVVAFCQTIEEAERLVKALSALNEDKPHYRYEYELIAPYNSIFDEHFDIQNIPGVLDDTLPF